MKLLAIRFSKSKTNFAITYSLIKVNNKGEPRLLTLQEWQHLFINIKNLPKLPDICRYVDYCHPLDLKVDGVSDQFYQDLQDLKAFCSCDTLQIIN